MTNNISTSDNAGHTPPTNTDLTNNSSSISNPSGSNAAGGNGGGSTTSLNSGGVHPANSDNLTSDPMAQSLPPAQDAGQTNAVFADLHTGVATIPLPPTSSTGTGFNAPDAGTGVLDNSSGSDAGTTGASASAPADNAPLPGVGNIDRDALAGQNKGAGSQANAEAVSSTGPL